MKAWKVTQKPAMIPIKVPIFIAKEKRVMLRYPVLVGEMLYPAEGLEPIGIETPAWFAWLREHTTFIYQDVPLSFTARREQRPGGMYWYAYKRAHGKLLKRYLGRGDALTLQHLQNVAQHFLLRVGETASSATPSNFTISEPDRLPEGGQITLLATKFHIPALPIHHIVRPRLRDALEQQTKTRLTLVCAPAGSGKTTLLASWAQATTLPVAWLSLEEADDDPLRFLSYLLAACSRISTESNVQNLTFSQALHRSSWEEILILFVNDLTRALTRDIVLILDDYHLMTVEPVHAALRFLIEHIPSHLHLLIGTRNDPPLPLARLRAHSQLCEIREEELRFASPEVHEFLQAMELQLSPELQAVLEQRTQGWIVGIQLLALALRGQNEMASLLQNHPGTHPFFLEYISDELLERLPGAIRGFLLRTSILDRLTGSLCEAITGLPDGQQQLLELYQRNLLINALDDTGAWYSYHPLFAEALRVHLRRLEPELISELYCRASCWYEAHGDAEEACHYALQANDYARAARLLANLLPSLVAQGKFARLSQWLARLPPAEIEASPQLSLAGFWRQAAGVRSPEAIANMLVSMEERVQERSQGTSAPWVDMQSQVTLFRALTALSQNDPGRTTAILEEALHSLPAQETAFSLFISFLLRVLLSIMYSTSGNLEAAERIVLDISMPHTSEVPFPLNLLAWWVLTELYEAQGQLRKWGSLSDTLFQVLGSHPDLPPFPLAVIHLSRATLLYEWNRLPEAMLDAQQAQRLAEHVDFGPLTAFIQWVLARIELAQGNAEAVGHLLEREAKQERWTRYPSLAARPARLALACGQLDVVWRWTEIRGLHADDQLNFRSNYFEYMTLVRVLIARGHEERDTSLLSAALNLLGRWRKVVIARGFQGNFIEIQMLTSLALAAQGKTKRALTTLGTILPQAEAEGYVRLFADESQPMTRLLAQIAPYTSASPRYVRELLDAQIPGYSWQEPEQRLEARQQLVDPLTARELDVLRLLAEGFSNQQIADRLVITLNTAKRHVKHILAKLTTTNRTRAVARARELHLL